MKEMIFETSGLIKDSNNIAEIELWGHDGGEFFSVEVEEPLKIADVCSGELGRRLDKTSSNNE